MSKATLYNEKELLQLSAGGDEQAYKILFEHYSDKMYINALHFTKSPEMAEDLVQEIFIRIWVKREKLAAVHRFDAYLFTVARNLIRNELKKKVFAADNESFLQTYFLDSALSPAEQLEYQELESRINGAIQSLPPQLQTAFRLSREQGLTHEEIARQMNISVVTSKTYMVRCLLAIRKYLGDQNLRVAILLYFILYK